MKDGIDAGKKTAMRKRVAIMRPKEYIDDTAKMFKKEGFDVVAVPFIRIVPTSSADNLLKEDFDYLIITSQTSARILSEYIPFLKDRGKIICIGKKTAEIFEKQNISVEVPEKFDSRSLYNSFKKVVAGKKVILCRSDRGDPVLLKLRDVSDFKEFVLYKIEFIHGAEQENLVREIANDYVDFIIFSSRMMVKSFFSLAERVGLGERVKDSLSKKSIAIGPPTAEELSNHGINPVVPEVYTFDGVLDLLKKLS